MFVGMKAIISCFQLNLIYDLSSLNANQSVHPSSMTEVICMVKV